MQAEHRGHAEDAWDKIARYDDALARMDPKDRPSAYDPPKQPRRWCLGDRSR